MPIGAYGLLLAGIALILLGVLYLRRGFLPRPEPYRKSEDWKTGGAVSRGRTAELAAGTALVIAGIILILFFASMPSLSHLFE
ncbi:hypothetical protein [Saccharibacillus sacchari]|uniref:Uncharacterized protein n=1 Tax=Saccharibacillus sacchari TaxID=456493 RepID=A0ACC6PFE4_9BACL